MCNVIQVCSRGPLKLNTFNTKLESGETEESRIWSERESACREALISMNIYDSCFMWGISLGFHISSMLTNFAHKRFCCKTPCHQYAHNFTHKRLSRKTPDMPQQNSFFLQWECWPNWQLWRTMSMPYITCKQSCCQDFQVHPCFTLYPLTSALTIAVNWTAPKIQ